MYLTWQRGKAMAAAWGTRSPSFLSPVRQELRAFPSLCDTLGHVNNARYLDLVGLGRFEWFARLGAGPRLLRERYTYLIAGAALTYRREIPRWSRFSLQTQLVEYDERWVCFLSSFELVQDGATRVAARALTRGQLRRRDGTGSLPTLLQAMDVMAEPCPPLAEDLAAQLEAQNLTVDVIRRHEGR